MVSHHPTSAGSAGLYIMYINCFNLRFWRDEKTKTSTSTLLGGGFNPSEKYESNWKSSPIFGVKLKHIWNRHHLDYHWFSSWNIAAIPETSGNVCGNCLHNLDRENPVEPWLRGPRGFFQAQRPADRQHGLQAEWGLLSHCWVAPSIGCMPPGGKTKKTWSKQQEPENHTCVIRPYTACTQKKLAKIYICIHPTSTIID